MITIMNRIVSSLGVLLLGAGTMFFAVPSHAAEKKKLVLIAGRPSHGPLQHEHNAGMQLLKKCLSDVADLEVAIHLNGWPKDEAIFEGADAIVIYSDGGGGHPAVQDDRLKFIDKLMKEGAGFGAIHYGVEVPKDKGGKEFLDWMGGYFETFWSVNPHWDADFTSLPEHPVTRGVKPFKIRDEWYYHMRFPENMKGVTPILTAIPPESTRGKEGVNSAHGGNPHVQARKGMPEHVMWVYDRPDGGRGFGITGGHFHLNWGHDDFRKVVLNALLWITKVDVPVEGIECKITEADLMANLDPKRGQRPPVKPSASVPPGKAGFKSGLVRSGSVDLDVDIAGADGLWLVVTDGGDGFGCDWADWAEPRLVKADGSEVKLTELKWRSADAGWGKVNINRNASGGPLKIAGKPILYGIGTHAPSTIEYDIKGREFTRFKARAGLDNGGTDQGCGSTVEFLVFTDEPGDLAAQSTARSAPVSSSNRTHGPEAAQEYLKTMSVADGLEVTLFASEPQLINPANMDIDSRGRVWVTEGANYRRWSNLRPEGDRIVILDDTNGDGRADVAKTFYQGNDVNSALGIFVLGSKVIVSSSPKVMVFSDADGDDKADGPPEVWFNGIQGVQHDHGVHAFVFGPDGQLYFNIGNDGKQLKTPDGRNFIVDLAGNEVAGHGKPYRQGMIFRCDPDGSSVETLAWNFRNNYEVAVDSFGTLWQSDNDDDGNKAVRVNYVMEFGNFGYQDEMTGAGWRSKRSNMEKEIPDQHWHQNDPGVVPNLLITGAGSPTGILVYEDDLLPEVFRNQMIHCDAGPRVVRAYPVEKDGAGYKASMTNILTSSDSWFRPSDVCVAPDGSIYVADWNDPGVGGHNMGDRELETMRGRVYRVAPRGHKPEVPKWDLKSAAGCVAALKSPNLATRYLAWTDLHKMQEGAESELLKLWKDANPRFRARALHLLARIKGKEEQYLNRAVEDTNPDIRITALRIARERKLDVIPLVKKLVRDSSPQVRRECAIALRHNPSSEAPKLWTILARQHDGQDRWYLEALGIGMDQQADQFFNAWLAAVGKEWNTPAGRDIVWRSRASKAPALLVKIITDKNTPADQRERYLRALDFIQGPERDAALIELITAGVN